MRAFLGENIHPLTVLMNNVEYLFATDAVC